MFVLGGPEQVRPRNFESALSSRSFKQQFPLFVTEKWKDQSYAHIIGTRDVYLGTHGYCYHYYVLDGQVIRESVDDMVTNHEEADTLVCFHARCMDNSGETGNIVVRANDTDIAIIFLYHSHTFTATLWMDTGTNAKNTRRYINLTAIGEVLGPLLSESLPAFHAFTVCDYTSAFVKKGKKRPFARLCQSWIRKGGNGHKPQLSLNIHGFNVRCKTKGELDASEQVQTQGIPEGLWPKSNRKKSPREIEGLRFKWTAAL